MILTHKVAYKVRMKSGRLTREKWVKNEVTEGQLVRDVDGRLFHVLSAVKLAAPALGLTYLVTEVLPQHNTSYNTHATA